MAKVHFNKGGSWYTPKKIFFNKGGTWYEAKTLNLKKGSTWYACVSLAPTGNTMNFTRLTSPGTIVWREDGSTARTGSTAAPDWLSSVSTGNGAGFWIRFTQSSGTGSGTFGTWLQMTSDRSISVTASAGQIRTSTGTYEVAASSGGTVLATGNYYIEVDRT